MAESCYSFAGKSPFSRVIYLVQEKENEGIPSAQDQVQNI